MLDIQGYLVLFLLWFISATFIRSIFIKSLCVRLPPGPPISIPLLGHAPYLSSVLHQALYKLSLRYSPWIHVMIGSKHVVVASSAETAKQILKTSQVTFCNCPIMIANETDYLFILSGRKTLEHFVKSNEVALDLQGGSDDEEGSF